MKYKNAKKLICCFWLLIVVLEFIFVVIPHWFSFEICQSVILLISFIVYFHLLCCWNSLPYEPQTPPHATHQPSPGGLCWKSFNLFIVDDEQETFYQSPFQNFKNLMLDSYSHTKTNLFAHSIRTKEDTRLGRTRTVEKVILSVRDSSLSIYIPYFNDNKVVKLSLI